MIRILFETGSEVLVADGGISLRFSPIVLVERPSEIGNEIAKQPDYMADGRILDFERLSRARRVFDQLQYFLLIVIQPFSQLVAVKRRETLKRYPQSFPHRGHADQQDKRVIG